MIRAYAFVERVSVVFDVAVVIAEEGVESTTGRAVIPRVVPDVPFSHEMSGIAESSQIFR